MSTEINKCPECGGKGIYRKPLTYRKNQPKPKSGWGRDRLVRCKKCQGTGKLNLKENEHLIYRASDKHLKTYLNFMKMRRAKGQITPADEEMEKVAQKHYAHRLLHNVLTSKNIKEETIVQSLAKAGQSHENHLKKVEDALNKLPVGHTITHKNHTFTHTNLGGDHFWIHNKGKGYTGRGMYQEIGHKALIPHIGHKALGLREDAPTNVAGAGNIAGIGISSPTIKNPPQDEPGFRKRPKVLRRLRNIVK